MQSYEGSGLGLGSGLSLRFDTYRRSLLHWDGSILPVASPAMHSEILAFGKKCTPLQRILAMPPLPGQRDKTLVVNTS